MTSLRTHLRPRLGFDELLVTAVVVALFFEWPDDSLWVDHGFPVPNPIFVLISAVVVGRAAFLASRGRFDLSKPNWVELSVIALIAVFAVTALAASIVGNSKLPLAGSGVLISNTSSTPYVISPDNARVDQSHNARASGWTLRVQPRNGSNAEVGVGPTAIPANPAILYTFSALVRSSASPEQVSLALRQQFPGATAKRVEVVRRFAVSPRRWTRVVLSTNGVPGARSIEPLFVVPGSARPAPVLISGVELVGKPSVSYLASDRDSPYAFSAKNAHVRQEPNSHSSGWTVSVVPVAGAPAAVSFPADVPPLPLDNHHTYTLSARVRATLEAYGTMILRQWTMTDHRLQAVDTRVNFHATNGWTPLKVSAVGYPANPLHVPQWHLAALFTFQTNHPRPVHISGLQIVSTPEVTPRAVASTLGQIALVSHLGQSLKTVVHFAYLALIALLLGRLLTPALMRRAFVTFFVLAVAAAVIACLQALDQNALHTGLTKALHLRSRGYTGFIRPVSIFSEPAILGYYMLVAVIVGLWLNGVSRSRWIWAGMGLCIVATLLGAAAGPVVALLVVALYLSWRASLIWRRYWRQLAILAAAAIALLVFVPAGSNLVQRARGTFSGSDQSAQFRYKFDSASVTIWKLSPFTGVGAGNDRYYNPALVHFTNVAEQTQFQSVSSYLGVLSESGVFGFLALVTMMLGLFLPLPRVRREGSWVTEAPILVFIVAFFFINALAYPVFWFWAGVRLAHLRHLDELGFGDSEEEYPGTPEAVTA